MRISYTFDEVKHTATKYIMKDGKKVRRQKTFSQTINPFNVKEDGTVKTRLDIQRELVAEAKEWENASE